MASEVPFFSSNSLYVALQASIHHYKELNVFTQYILLDRLAFQPSFIREILSSSSTNPISNIFISSRNGRPTLQVPLILRSYSGASNTINHPPFFISTCTYCFHYVLTRLLVLPLLLLLPPLSLCSNFLLLPSTFSASTRTSTYPCFQYHPTSSVSNIIRNPQLPASISSTFCFHYFSSNILLPLHQTFYNMYLALLLLISTGK